MEQFEKFQRLYGPDGSSGEGSLVALSTALKGGCGAGSGFGSRKIVLAVPLLLSVDVSGSGSVPGPCIRGLRQPRNKQGQGQREKLPHFDVRVN